MSLRERLAKIVYATGLRKSFRRIDRLHYLKRLSRRPVSFYTEYISDKDLAQFDTREVAVACQFEGKVVIFLCDPNSHIERQVVNRGGSNTEIIGLIRAFVSEGGTIIDVGAHIGTYSIPLAMISAGPVHAFEPNPAALLRLRSNLALNAISNITVHEVAVGSACETRELFACDSKDLGLSSFVESAAVQNRRKTLIPVPVVTLDKEFPEGSSSCRVDLIKIDVQGFEADVLEGAEKLVGRDRPVILFEHEDKNFPSAENAAVAKKRLAGFFGVHNYQVFYVTRKDVRLWFPVIWSGKMDGDFIALPVLRGRQ
jgi:FkbM family methyltransferase